MIFRPLPDIEEEPEDEKNNPDFQSMLAELLSTDGEYLESVNQLSAEDLNYEAQIRKAERALRDRIRDKFGMEPIKDESVDQYLKQLAKSHNLNPSWELGYEVKGDAHQDNEMQTLLDPDRFIRRIRNLNTKVKNITRETGINVLQICFGFLEWVETNQKKRLSPLLLLPLTLERKKTGRGQFRYELKAEDSAPSVNASLVEALKPHDIDLKEIEEEESIKDYHDRVRGIISQKIDWKIKTL